MHSFRSAVVTCIPVPPIPNTAYTPLQPRWRLTERPDSKATAALAHALEIDAVTAGVLVQRGIDTYDLARAYFKPTWADLHDPFLMKGMPAAAERLAKAIREKEQVVVYGDYDVDGTTSIAVIGHFLSRYGVPFEYYVPDRIDEGYGLSQTGVEFAQSVGAALLIVLDCGTKDLSEVAYAHESGLDVIICDHHEPGEQLPSATAFLNPKQPGCGYPFKELCACAVAFKLVQATDTLCNLGFALEEVIDRVAVAIACDLVPMTGENRALAHLGLERLVERPSRGLAALMAQSDKDRRWRISDVVFFLGPRINAAGRVGHANTAVELLLGRAPEVDALAAELSQLNTERKALEHTATETALLQAEALRLDEGLEGLVVADAHWHKGVVGIVAAKLVERFHRPAVVLTQQEGVWMGSARSVPGFDLYNALEACRAHLTQFGGHTHAAGLSLADDQLQAFCAAFAAYCTAHLSEEARTPTQLIDAVVSLGDLSGKFARLHARMEPFGPGNRRPVFAALGLLPEKARVVGTDHLSLLLRQGDAIWPAMGFGLAEVFEQLPRDTPLAAAFYPEYHHWQGRTTLRLQLKDLKTQAQAEAELGLTAD